MKAFFTKITKDYSTYEKRRGMVVREAGQALNMSKRAIFAYHRDDFKAADALLEQAEKIFKNLDKLAQGIPKLKYEGSWRAALEEYCEAKFFGNYLKNKTIGFVRGRQIEADIYLAGLCDFTGELLRRAVKEATDKNIKEVKAIKATMEQVMENLIQMDLTGYVRTKFDAAKNNLRKIEQILYELSLRS
jgi:predicted translin family RNA/ssDNA-binding protein